MQTLTKSHLINPGDHHNHADRKRLLLKSNQIVLPTSKQLKKLTRHLRLQKSLDIGS